MEGEQPCPVFEGLWLNCWSGKRDSNSRLQPWQGYTLPLSYSRSPIYTSQAAENVHSLLYCVN